MSELQPNLFNALFQFHPREGHTPKENFLSEAFAYVLTTCDSARDAWVSLALGRRVQVAQFQISTRNAERDEDSVTVFPDMNVSGILQSGEAFEILNEHKWDSPGNPVQLKRYLKLAERRGQNCTLCFIGASRNQKLLAQSCDSRMRGRAFLWEEVFQSLDGITTKPVILQEFLTFMAKHGLSPGKPIDSCSMVAFIQSSGFLASLEHSANKLCDDYEWDFIPQRYRPEGSAKVSNHWGRIAIEFATPAWRPTVTVGFLFDESNHEVKFVDPKRGIDLLFRIETAPADQKNIGSALAEVDRKRKRLTGLAASALLLHEPGNGNAHSLLIVRSCLADVISNTRTQAEQLDSIYSKLKSWGEVLFSDGALEKALEKAGLDSEPDPARPPR